MNRLHVSLCYVDFDICKFTEHTPSWFILLVRIFIERYIQCPCQESQISANTFDSTADSN